MRKRKRAMEPSKQKQKQNQRIQKGGQQKQTLILIHFHMWHDHVNNVSHYFREFEWWRGEGDGMRPTRNGQPKTQSHNTHRKNTE